MTDLRLDIANSDNSKITLQWDAMTVGTQTGGVALLRYEVEEYDQVNSMWVPVGTSTTNSLLLTPVNAGEVYKYQIRAVNKYGPGQFSNSFTVIAGQKPNTPSAPTLTLNNIYI